MSKYGKSKTTVKLLITLLIGLPIVSFINSLIIASVYDLRPSEMVDQSAGIIVLFFFFGAVFAIYSFYLEAI